MKQETASTATLYYDSVTGSPNAFEALAYIAGIGLKS
jgi:hypothetical protein